MMMTVTGHDKDRTRQDETGQDRTGQDRTDLKISYIK